VQPRTTSSEYGAVTAEFVMLLPVMLMIIGITLGSLSLQFERMKLVSIAATISRAIARGEPEEKVMIFLGGLTLSFENTTELICAKVSKQLNLPGLPGLPLEVSDQECARKLGL
jgi:hypothetical protein